MHYSKYTNNAYPNSVQDRRKGYAHLESCMETHCSYYCKSQRLSVLKITWNL